MLPQAGCGWGEELDFSSVLCSERKRASTTYHEEGISNPETPPSSWAVGDGDILTVDCNGDGWGLAHGTAANVGLDVILGHRHHGQRGSGGQPVGLVVAAGIVAHITRVAVQEGHGAEPSQAGARQPCGKGPPLSMPGRFPGGPAKPRRSPGEAPRPHVRGPSSSCLLGLRPARGTEPGFPVPCFRGQHWGISALPF